MKDKVLKQKLRMPDDAALDKLASILEGWRLHFLGEQSLNPLRHKTHLAATDLAEALKRQREIYVKGITETHAQFLRDNVETIDCALSSLNGIWLAGMAVEYVGSFDPHWKWLADDALPGDFATAIQSTNPNVKLGIGHTGPLARFISAVVPHLTGEKPSAQSVATQLKAIKRLKAIERLRVGEI